MNKNIELRRRSLGFYLVYMGDTFIGYVAWFFGWKGVPCDVDKDTRGPTYKCKSKEEAANAVFEDVIFHVK